MSGRVDKALPGRFLKLQVERKEKESVKACERVCVRESMRHLLCTYEVYG